MQSIEDTANKLTDQDWGWWPFLFLKPDKHVPMNSSYVFKISLFFGITYGSLFGIIGGLIVIPKVIDLSEYLPIFPGFIILYTLLFFALYRITFAHFWNRRAKRLQESG